MSLLVLVATRPMQISLLRIISPPRRRRGAAADRAVRRLRRELPPRPPPPPTRHRPMPSRLPPSPIAEDGEAWAAAALAWARTPAQRLGSHTVATVAAVLGVATPDVPTGWPLRLCCPPLTLSLSPPTRRWSCSARCSRALFATPTPLAHSALRVGDSERKEK